MAVSTQLKLILYLVIAVNAVIAKISEHRFEFGETGVGEVVYEKEGKINLFSYNNTYIIPILSKKIRSVFVSVDSRSSPKVTYDDATRTVNVVYKLWQWTPSTYKIVVKASQVARPEGEGHKYLCGPGFSLFPPVCGRGVDTYIALLFGVDIIGCGLDYFRGSHKIGEIESFKLEGKVPAFYSNHAVSMKPVRKDVEQNYTYISVVTMPVLSISSPQISFNPKTNYLSIYIKYPFFPVPYHITGFSMPIIKFQSNDLYKSRMDGSSYRDITNPF